MLVIDAYSIINGERCVRGFYNVRLVTFDTELVVKNHDLGLGQTSRPMFSLLLTISFKSKTLHTTCPDYGASCYSRPRMGNAMHLPIYNMEYQWYSTFY